MHPTISAKPPRAPARLKSVAGLVPLLLLLSMAVSNAYAAPTVIVAPSGADGADATGPNTRGGNGGAGGSITRLLTQVGAANSLVLTGGAGGNGGRGSPSQFDPDTGDFFGGASGGIGGDGGAASATAISVVFNAPLAVEASTVGGNGGRAGASGNIFGDDPSDPLRGRGGNGGAANSVVSAIGSGSAAVVARASAVGGNGGDNAQVPYSLAGNGGGASARAYGRSGSGDVTVGAAVTGGNGGNDVAGGPGNAAGSGASVSLDNAVGGATSGRLSLSQSAVGGNAGAINAQGGQPFDGGSASSTLVLSNSGASVLTAAVSATGGHSFAGMGGAAAATARLSGRGAVDGSATANGGHALGFNLAAGGNATAALTVSAGGLASGVVAAYGGDGALMPRGDIINGAATAELTLSGTGATGTSLAQGASASSTVRATTTGARAVDVAATAIGRIGGGDTRALTTVTTAPAGGAAAVRANATALGGNTGALANASVDVTARGNISGTSLAQGGYVGGAPYPMSGDAVSTISAVTSGRSAVTVGAIARADIGDRQGTPAWFGNANASAYGRAGSGAVDVTAEARGGSAPNAPAPNTAVAQASAVTLERGGVSTARAVASGGSIDVRAAAQAVNAAGNTVGFAAGAVGAHAVAGSALAGSAYQASAFALAPLTGGTYMASNAAAAPASAAALGLGAAVTGAIPTPVGVGSQTLANGLSPADLAPGTGELRQGASGQFQFTSSASEHLLIGFVSSTFLGAGFDVLDLAISNNGVQLFSRSFTSLADANLFFTDHVLDLGAFGGLSQNVSITSSLSFTQPSAYAFNYVLGIGGANGPVGGPVGGVSAVPEPSAWLMMVIGMGGLVLVARRRRARAA